MSFVLLRCLQLSAVIAPIRLIFIPARLRNIGEIKLWGAIYGSVLRPCVPLFVMITGALLLPVKGDASTFYKKRIPRVFYPFLIWLVLYNLFPWITGLLGLNPRLFLISSRMREKRK